MLITEMLLVVFKTEIYVTSVKYYLFSYFIYFYSYIHVIKINTDIKFWKEKYFYTWAVVE